MSLALCTAASWCLLSSPAEHKPHIERRVKTIVEEIVDGKVVSSSVDTQVEDLQ